MKSACLILAVFLSLGFSSAHRLLLDQANDDHKRKDPPQLEAVKPNGVGVGVGFGEGGGGVGYGEGTGSGPGGIGYGEGIGTGSGSGPGGIGYGKGIGIGSGSDPGCSTCVPAITIPIPQIPIPQIPQIPIPQIPEVPGCQPAHSVEGPTVGGPDCNLTTGENCSPFHHHGQTGESATVAAKMMEEPTNRAREPYPPDMDHI
ncbi:hypothetical protein REPUB_Repub05bG0061100 [Reevesia pubescens]